MPPEFRRKNIRLHAENYKGPRGYFLTLCFHRRQAFGGSPEIARWLIEAIKKPAAGNGFLVPAYCVMPDHVHLLVQGTQAESDLLRIVNAYKQVTAHEFQQKKNLRLWQFKFYDHILRPRESGDAIAWYIWMNPVRKGLCRLPQEYPWSGSFTKHWADQLNAFQEIEWTPPWKKM
jgi:putative transposase